MSLPCCKCKCKDCDKEYGKLNRLPLFKRGQKVWITTQDSDKGPFKVTMIVYEPGGDQFLYYLTEHLLRYGEKVLTDKSEAGEVFVCGDHQEAYYVK